MANSSQPAPHIETRSCNQIQCLRLPELPPEQVWQIQARDATMHRTKYNEELDERKAPTSSYNCHGMTFLSRRAWLNHTAPIDMIVIDDGYEEISQAQTMPGDIAIYYDRRHGIIHTATIIRIDQSQDNPAETIPWVLSKWGMCGEYIHRFDHSPYQDDTDYVKFMREGRR